MINPLILQSERPFIEFWQIRYGIYVDYQTYIIFNNQINYKKTAGIGARI